VTNKDIVEYTQNMFIRSGGSSDEAVNFLRQLNGTSKEVWRRTVYAALFWYGEKLRLERVIRDSTAGSIEK
jgi:hypothetical protein